VRGSDILTDLYIGRFPSRSPEEAQTMVEKTLSYEQIASDVGWNANLSFVADNDTSFAERSHQIINTFIPSWYQVNKIFYDGVNYPSISSARTAIISAINKGNLIVNYFGHGAVLDWDSLIRVIDLPQLANENKLPFIVPMTYLKGYFV
jgi:hypothetical protein